MFFSAAGLTELPLDLPERESEVLYSSVGAILGKLSWGETGKGRDGTFFEITPHLRRLLCHDRIVDAEVRW